MAYYSIPPLIGHEQWAKTVFYWYGYRCTTLLINCSTISTSMSDYIYLPRLISPQKPIIMNVYIVVLEGRFRVSTFCMAGYLSYCVPNINFQTMSWNTIHVNILLLSNNIVGSFYSYAYLLCLFIYILFHKSKSDQRLKW